MPLGHFDVAVKRWGIYNKSHLAEEERERAFVRRKAIESRKNCQRQWCEDSY